jgi:hypothetical protein
LPVLENLKNLKIFHQENIVTEKMEPKKPKVLRKLEQLQCKPLSVHRTTPRWLEAEDNHTSLKFYEPPPQPT